MQSLNASQAKHAVPGAMPKPGLSTEDRIAMLWKWDFGRVISKLANATLAGDLREATEMVAEDKKYIALHIRTGDNMPMSVQVDPAWHTHLLFTRDYAQFCRDIIGHFLHHEPTVQELEVAALADGYRNTTLRHYETYFGPAPQKWWPAGAQICEPPGCHSGCGDA